MFNVLSLCAQEVRRSDWDRYLFTLFAPLNVREDLFTFLAFNIEIAKIANIVSDPLLGQIRLKWWQDAINEIYNGNHGGISGHYVLDKLPEVILNRGLTRSLVDKLILTRSAELSSWPPKDESALLDYIIGTSSTLNIILLEILGEKNNFKDRASDLGVAWGLINFILAFPTLARREGSPLPIRVLATNDTRSEHDGGLRQTVQAVCELAEEYLNKTRIAEDKVVRSLRTVFLSSKLTAYYIREISKYDYNPYSIDLRKGRVSRQIIVGLTALLDNY